jgi:anthranilate phosphoribosyltransferase
MFAQTLKLLGTHRALVVHGHDGMDEITVCAPTRVSELKDGMIRSYDLDPLEFFDDYADPSALKGGDAGMNAAITRKILAGELGPGRNIVLINAAAALMASDAAMDIAGGIKMAEEAIDSGRAMAKLDDLIRFTRENG